MAGMPKNKIITKAIEDGYKGLVMQHKFPFVSLRIEMDGNDLDVNVHPAKKEVRFARETEVYTAIYETVRKVLTLGTNPAGICGKRRTDISQRADEARKCSGTFRGKKTAGDVRTPEPDGEYSFPYCTDSF